MKNQKGISTLSGIIIIIVIAVVAFGGVFAYQYFSTKTADQLQVQSDQQNQNQQQQTENSPNTTEQNNATDQTAGWKTYRNDEYGFEIKYPNNDSANIRIENCQYDLSSTCPIAKDFFEEFNIKITSPDYKTVDRVVSGGTPVCTYHLADGATSSYYLSYWYMAAKENKCFLVNVEGEGTTSCGVFYGDDELVRKCEKENFDTSKLLKEDIPSTFKFTK